MSDFFHPGERASWLPDDGPARPCEIREYTRDGLVRILCDDHEYPITVNPADLQPREA